jgi:hypothetical protein
MAGPPEDRRVTKRVKQTQTIRIRPAEPEYSDEIRLTLNVSWDGLYFATSKGHYSCGMTVYVTRNYRPSAAENIEERGKVVRIDQLREGRWGIAIKFEPDA